MIFRKSLLRELVTVAAADLPGAARHLAHDPDRAPARPGGERHHHLGQPSSTLLGFSLVNYLPVLLSLTLFISVLMTLSRSYRDSEMVVWFSSGLGLTRVDPPGARVCRAARRHDRACCR